MIHSKWSVRSLRKKPAGITKPVLMSLVMLGTILPMSATLSGCGFHLRGYDTPINFEVDSTILTLDDDAVSFPLKRPLTQRLENLGIDVVDNMGRVINTADRRDTAAITVSNVQFREFELVGVLTEIRLIISADVTYQTLRNGEPITVTNPIQVERSYQYDEASVNVDDQQGDQIRSWLYEALARRITDQYVALTLPQVSAIPTAAPAEAE